MLFNACPLVNSQRKVRQLKLTDGLTPTSAFGADLLLPHFEGVLRGILKRLVHPVELSEPASKCSRFAFPTFRSSKHFSAASRQFAATLSIADVDRETCATIAAAISRPPDHPGYRADPHQQPRLARSHLHNHLTRDTKRAGRCRPALWEKDKRSLVQLDVVRLRFVGSVRCV